MKQASAFHHTARGQLHIMRGAPCEDHSASFSHPDGRYHIAAAADGHGARECFRAAVGAQAAVETAVECLQELAGAVLASEEAERSFQLDLFSDPRYRAATLRRLTDTLLARWRDRIREHYREHPPTPEELGEGASLEDIPDRSIPRIYGATLMAALLLPGCLLLFHQGDGRIEVIYGDGTLDQPVPWDPRCEFNVTTSLCDADAFSGFRSCAIDLADREVIACYLGTDGVEDAYRDTYGDLGASHQRMGGVHTFYKHLSCQLVELGPEEFSSYLEELLPRFSGEGLFSRAGSGDDVSVAGIADKAALEPLADRFRHEVKRYGLDEALYWAEDELRGKRRKHGILQKRMEAAQAEADRLRPQLAGLEQEREQLEAEQQKLAASVQHVTEELDGIQPTQGTEDAQIPEPDRERISKAGCQNLMERLSACTARLKQLDGPLQALREAEDRLAQAKSSFEDYDAEVQAIRARLDNIQREIDALEAPAGNGAAAAET